MKQALTILFAALLLSTVSTAQNAFYDAKKLASMFGTADTVQTAEALGILGKYLTKQEKNTFNTNSTPATLKKIFSVSPTIDSLIGTLKVPDRDCETILNSIPKNSRIEEVQTLAGFSSSLKSITNNAVYKDFDILQNIKVTRLRSDGNMRQQFADLYSTYGDTVDIDPSNLSLDTLQVMYNKVEVEILEKRRRLNISRDALCQSVLDIYHKSTVVRENLSHVSLGAKVERFSKDYQLKINQEEKEAVATKDRNEQTNAQRLNLPTQSELIDAMAIYLANRVKLETALTFIEYIKRSLKSDSTLLNLFPETIRLFSTYSSYEMPNFGSVWQQAFAEDFVLIPQRLADFDDKHNYFFRKFSGTPTFNFLHQCIELAVLSSQKGNIIDIVQLLNEKYADVPADSLTLFPKFIRLFNMINEEFYSVDKNKFWISYSDFNKMSEEEFTILIDLLSKKYKDNVLSFLNVKKTWDDTKIDMNLKDLKAWMGKFFYVINQFQNNQQSAKELLQSGTMVKNNETFWSFLPELFKTIVGGLKDKNPVVGHDSKGKVVSLQTLSTIISAYENLCEIYNALEERDYSVAFDRTIHILDEVVSEANIKKGQTIVAFLKDVKKPQQFLTQQQDAIRTFSMQLDTIVNTYKMYMLADNVHQPAYLNRYKEQKVKFLADVNASKLNKYVSVMLKDNYNFDEFVRSNYNNMEEFVNKSYVSNYNTLTRTVSFINDIRRAGDSKTLSRVIASYANPPLSYKQKRGSRFSLDLNAYVGAFVGGEFRLNGAFSYSDPGVVYGLSAPIGFTASWGKSVKTKGISEGSFINRKGLMKVRKENNFMVTFSIIDIGAAVAYRISTGPENALPQKVTFAQVISPGLHAQWGIRNTPLCFSLGGQYTPELRKFSKDVNAKTETAFSVRAGVFFDLPLLNMYRR